MIRNKAPETYTGVLVLTPVWLEITGAAMPQIYPIMEHSPFAVARMVEVKDSGVYAYCLVEWVVALVSLHDATGEDTKSRRL